MKKRIILIVSVGVVLLAAVVIAALNAIFTVTRVEVLFSVRSETGETESHELQADLEEQFLGKSTTFLKLEDVEAAVKKYPAFELVSCAKGYPQTIYVQVSERTEMFSFRKDDGKYAVIDAEGRYLYDTDTNVNRMGGENVLLDGFALNVTESGERVTGEYVEELLTMAAAFGEESSDWNANVVSVTLKEHTMEGYYFHFVMREGVCFDIYTPKNKTREKALSAIGTYFELSETEKLYGYFDLMDIGTSEEFSVSRHYDAYPVE